jgi:hypothetical protein
LLVEVCLSRVRVLQAIKSAVLRLNLLNAGVDFGFKVEPADFEKSKRYGQ